MNRYYHCQCYKLPIISETKYSNNMQQQNATSGRGLAPDWYLFRNVARDADESNKKSKQLNFIRTENYNVYNMSLSGFFTLIFEE